MKWFGKLVGNMFKALWLTYLLWCLVIAVLAIPVILLYYILVGFWMERFERKPMFSFFSEILDIWKR